VALALVLVLAVGCGRSEPATSDRTPPPRADENGSTSPAGDPGAQDGSDGTSASPTSSASPSEDGNGDGRETASEDDLKTFAFATTDESELAEQTVALAEIVATMQQHAAGRDLDAVEQDARALIEAAEGLERAAANAEDRQRPLEPEDVDLGGARRDAIDAFGLTADYAGTAVDLAQAALDLDLQELVAVAQDASDLAGTSEELAAAYADLNTALVAWAEAHPADAAKALAIYA